MGLAGLEQLSVRQLFWLAAAMGHAMGCEKARPLFVLSKLAADDHGPNSVRTLGPATSLQEFSRDWNCKKGARHNPTQKCSFWGGTA